MYFHLKKKKEIIILCIFNSNYLHSGKTMLVAVYGKKRKCNDRQTDRQSCLLPAIEPKSSTSSTEF